MVGADGHSGHVLVESVYVCERVLFVGTEFRNHSI